MSDYFVKTPTVHRPVQPWMPRHLPTDSQFHNEHGVEPAATEAPTDSEVDEDGDTNDCGGWHNAALAR